MTGTTIFEITRELLTLGDIDLVNGYFEGQDKAFPDPAGSYKVNLGLLKTKFTSGMTSTYDTTLGTAASIGVGGITAGTTANALSGKTLTEMFDTLLFPTQYPTLTNPSNTFADDQTELQEIAASLNILFTIGFSRGSISPAYGTSGFRSGIASAYNYTGTGLSSPTGSPTQGISSYAVLQGYQTWTGSVTYLIGEQPKDSKGNNYSTALSAGTTSSASSRIEGVYPLFGTTSTISNPNTQQTLVSMITGNNIVFVMVSESGGNKQSFDIPVAWTSARSLVTVQTYNTVSSTWDTTGLGQWTTSSVTHTVQGNVINYTRYLYNSADRGNVSIRIVF